MVLIDLASLATLMEVLRLFIHRLSSKHGLNQKVFLAINEMDILKLLVAGLAFFLLLKAISTHE